MSELLFVDYLCKTAMKKINDAQYMKLLLILLLLGSSLSVFAQLPVEVYQRAKITYQGSEQLLELASLDIPVDHGVHKRGHFIISEFSISELERAREHGFVVDVLIEDAKSYFLEENRKNVPTREFNPSCDNPSVVYDTPANFNQGSMGGYLTYQEVLNEFTQMKALYPNLITEQANIGNFTTEGQPDNSTTPPIGGNGIKWVKISDNPNSSNEGEPQILYTSIHHAREPASLMQLIFYMWYLLENYDTDLEVQSIVNNTELYFVPVVNPDGYLYNEKTDPNGGGFWRKNRKNGSGVDNNRNYNYFINGDPNNGSWGGPGSSSNPNSGTYHGTGPFSEAENQAMKWFVEQHDFVMAFNNHTSGQLLYFPFAYANVPTPEEELFIGISSELVSQNGYTNLRDSPFSGESDDFMYGTVLTHDKIYSFTPEIGTSFWPPANQIEGICKNMMFLNLTAAKMVNNYASIEDTAPLFTGGTAAANAEFDLTRLGVSGTGNFTVSLDPVSGNISSVGASVDFSNLEVLEVEAGIIPYTLVEGTVSGEAVIYDLLIDNGTFITPIRINKTFGETLPVFTDPGDSTTDNFNNNGWGTTNSIFVSPSSSITDSPSGNYSGNSNKTIALSEPIDLSTAMGASATFYAQWEIENNWDYAQFEVSTDNGSSWTPQCGIYTNDGSSNSGQPTGEPLYDGNQLEWVFEQINLSDYLGETILVRFQFVSDGNVNADGFYFDDLTINVVDDIVLGVSEIEQDSFVVYPNPVDSVLHIATPIQNYSIDLFNLQGQLIRSSDENQGSTTMDYSDLPGGMYLLRITAPQGFKVVRILKN
ncbi:MAG: immune inhibitor A [Bacteroidia bacterium]|nr:immune inhibitor A [Bacteroidia bacterium]